MVFKKKKYLSSKFKLEQSNSKVKIYIHWHDIIPNRSLSKKIISQFRQHHFIPKPPTHSLIPIDKTKLFTKKTPQFDSSAIIHHSLREQRIKRRLLRVLFLNWTICFPRRWWFHGITSRYLRRRVHRNGAVAITAPL